MGITIQTLYLINVVIYLYKELLTFSTQDVATLKYLTFIVFITVHVIGCLQTELDEKAKVLIHELFKTTNLASNENLLSQIRTIPFLCATRVNSK